MKIRMVSLFLLMISYCTAQNLRYSTTKPLVIRYIPNPISWTVPNQEDHFLFSVNDSNVCIVNDTTYWVPIHLEKEIYLAKKKGFDTVIIDTLHFAVFPLQLKDFRFTFKYREHHSGIIKTDKPNKLIFEVPERYKYLDLEKKLVVEWFTVCISGKVRSGDTIVPVDSIFKMESDLLDVWRFTQHLLQYSELELITVGFKYENPNCLRKLTYMEQVNISFDLW